MISNKNDDQSSGQPTPGENNPDEAITTPGEVSESNDASIDEDFPGYPHYPANEDLLDPDNNKGRVDVDVDNLTRSNAIDSLHLKNIEGVAPVEGITSVDISGDTEEDLEIVPGTEADVTAEDLLLLGARDADMDLGEDEELALRGWTPKAGTDLDVPDADLNDEDGDALGQGDEENSYYSLGGDSKDGLEENRENTF
jgi:hypothetical protein